MTQIVVSPERLETVASTFESQQAETENSLNLLRSALDNLDAEWDGVAHAKFYTQWNEMAPRIAQYSALLGEVAGELRRIAQVFRETDQHVI